MKKIIGWVRRFFAKHFICTTIFSNGHEPVPFYYEDDIAIYTHRCSRCHSILGLGTWKCFRDIHTPSCIHRKQWEEYYDQSLDKARRTAISDQIIYEATKPLNP